jgi:hypothetical protein
MCRYSKISAGEIFVVMSTINNSKTSDINRGVDLILRRRKPKKKTFSFYFEKMVSLFKKDITISFHFSFDIRNHT